MTNVDQLLNPSLYYLLERRFGDVKVTAPGIELVWRNVSDAAAYDTDGDSRMLYKRRVLVSGEEYRVCCPFCQDHAPRLYINHRWGVLDTDTGGMNLWLARCFNEECLTSVDRQMQLHAEVYSTRKLTPKDLRRGKQVQLIKPGEATLPGPCVRLDILAAEDPEHPAITYLTKRGFDPQFLGRRYDVSYCHVSDFFWARQRIIIPIKELGLLCGWQARHIGDSHGSLSLKEAGIPKYYNLRNVSRAQFGYNLEQAVRHQTVLLVEGPIDVWGAGIQACALFGKSANPAFVAKLQQWIQLYWGKDVTIVVMLDPTQDDKAAARGETHHIETCVDKLRAHLRRDLRNRIAKVYLPAGRDPGDYVADRVALRSLIRKQVEQQGLPVSFGKQTCKPELATEVLRKAIPADYYG